MRHLLSIDDLTTDEITELVAIGTEWVRVGCASKPLAGKHVGIYFAGPSTRTRTSFTVGAQKLGAEVITFGPSDLQLSTGETIQDTARVLSGYLDGLVARTNSSDSDMRAFTEQERMSVINAMSEREHPTQVIGDLITLKEAFGRLEDLDILYIGEGNNTAASLALVLAKLPNNRITLLTPERYGLKTSILERAKGLCAASGTTVREIHDLDAMPEAVDAVYTTRWETMGVSHANPDWKKDFEPYKVTREIMARASKPKGTVFMHDLPAIRGVDTEDEVLDGEQSIAFRQAFHKLTSAIAVLQWCICDQ